MLLAVAPEYLTKVVAWFFTTFRLLLAYFYTWDPLLTPYWWPLYAPRLVLSVRDRAVVDALLPAQTRIDAGVARMGYSWCWRCRAHLCAGVRIAPVLGLFLTVSGLVTGACAYETSDQVQRFLVGAYFGQISSAFAVGAYFGAL